MNAKVAATAKICRDLPPRQPQLLNLSLEIIELKKTIDIGTLFAEAPFIATIRQQFVIRKLSVIGAHMREWFISWQKLFGKVEHENKTPTESPQPFTQSWDLPAMPTLQWTAGETRVLLGCEKQKTICAITDHVRESPMQTVVLGCDPAAHQVLLDDFFPRPSVSPVGGRFQLQLPMGTGLLLLQVVVRAEIGVAKTPAYIAEVVDKMEVKDRRLNQRLQFNSASAPRIDLLVPFSPRLRGHLLDLSEGGFAMVYYGADKPKLFTRTGECRIDFDERFVLRAKVQVQQVRSRRKPFHHTVIRIRFSELTTAEKDRIRAFIQDCLAGTTRLSAA